MRKRFILKWDRHHDGGSGRYGVYDIAERRVSWCATREEAASRAARCNAVEGLNANLGSALGNISTILTGQLTDERRADLRDLRGDLRDIRAALPDVATLTAELAIEAATTGAA